MAAHRAWRGIGGLTLALALAGAALAQGTGDWPKHPVRVVVPYAVGGPSDELVRLVSPKLAERLGQPVVVDNRVGASGNIGTDFVAKSAPDGYTLFPGTNSPLAAVPALRKDPPYDALRDFTPISFVGKDTMFLVVNNGVPAKSVDDLVGMARAKPGKLNVAYGTTGALINSAQLVSLD